MAKQTVALYTVTSGDRVSRARDSLAEALGDARLGDPDDAGGFEVSVDAESPEAAIELVREAFARAGTGDDFVIQEGTEGREIPAGDARQSGDEASATTAGTSETAAAADDTPASDAEGGEGGGANGGGDRASLVADAASAVAAAASSAASGDTDAAREAASSAAEAARTLAAEAADSVREAASSARGAVDEKGVGGAASDYASSAAGAAQGRDWSRFAPIGAGLFLLIVLRRMRGRR